MGKFFFSISEENEEKLREVNRKKGDMSNLINYALDKIFKEKDEKELVELLKKLKAIEE